MTTPDPQTVREIAFATMLLAIRQLRDASVNMAVFDHGVPGLDEQSFLAYRSAAVVEYDRLAATLSLHAEQPPAPPTAEQDGARAPLNNFVAIWHDTALVQHEVDEIRCQKCRAYMAGPLPLPSPVTLADLVALAGRHECLPRMDARPADGSAG